MAVEIIKDSQVDNPSFVMIPVNKVAVDERYNPFRQTHRSRRRWTHRLVKMFDILVIATPQFSFSKSPLLALHSYVYRPLVQLLSPLAVY